MISGEFKVKRSLWNSWFRLIISNMKLSLKFKWFWMFNSRLLIRHFIFTFLRTRHSISNSHRNVSRDSHKCTKPSTAIPIDFDMPHETDPPEVDVSRLQNFTLNQQKRQFLPNQEPTTETQVERKKTEIINNFSLSALCFFTKYETKSLN